MAESTGISWTDSTFNPWRGCTKVSPGCARCYAEMGSKRNPSVLGIWGDKGTRVLAADAQWKEPPKWNHKASGGGLFDHHERHLVFCASLADIFEDWPGQMTDSQSRPLWWDGVHYDLPMSNQTTHARPYTLTQARQRLWDLVRETPFLTWQLLTKRPENIAKMMPLGKWPNVWLGTSVESQDYTVRIDQLQDAPQEVPVRFVSAEPLLGPLDLAGTLDRKSGVGWVIVGGESGVPARSVEINWVRDMITQCRRAKVPLFVKQLGKFPRSSDDPEEDDELEGLHGNNKNTEANDWPQDIRVQRFPRE